MIVRQWQIAIFGTFDVENYGDLLFPIIAEAELARRLGSVTLHRFSYHAKNPPEWPYAVTSLEDLPRVASMLDGMLIGGGFIVRFDKLVAVGYGPTTPAIHHPTGYWLTPALIALQHGIPLIWNAPGMHRNEIPAWAEPLVQLALEHSLHVRVRDQLSPKALAPFASVFAEVEPIVGNSDVLVRSDNSWHAVSRVADGCTSSRRSLTATFYRPGSVSSMWPPGDATPLHAYPVRGS